ncbi:hypothetical protein P7H00_14435 [Enterococcus pseudoavium]|uniref:Uncharacterized protein n=1 Tax=Enterococcus pseudoavium TaxID=44007 RepID=A0AAE4I5C1_9ENTE|nr:hypothetical protein [Enterococcus pseudoavium]MDT2738300.1 hypothetical protein [Enterococcus pseudoavium]
MEAVKNKKRDRTGEKYGEFTIIQATDNDKEWLARCSCGKERIVKNKDMSSLTHCNSCAARIRAAKRKGQSKKPKKDKFTEMQNWMSPKMSKFKTDFFYTIEDDRFHELVVGKLINEYRHTAAFEIINYHESDKATLREQNFRILVAKKKATKMMS